MAYHVATFDSVNNAYTPQLDGNGNMVVYPTVAAATTAGIALDNGAVKSFVIWSDAQLAYETPAVVSGGVYVA